MNLSDLASKIEGFSGKMNDKGIPVPLARDKGIGSFTATTVVISVFMVTMTILLMIATVLNKLSNLFIIDDTTMTDLKQAFDASLYFFITTMGFYLGRRMQKSATGVSVDDLSNSSPIQEQVPSKQIEDKYANANTDK